ncbi:SMI1/KNR4 family protein [Streptomyces sp. 3N207]|uniref:SMI1/KNR4 family protein n=1 Tax=Streptomyces sp. 3N207 TaxID=3457417 RepID=UPI003FD25D24
MVPAGDPDEAVRLFHDYRRLMAQILGYEEELPEPASEEDLGAPEEELGVVLPPDLLGETHALRPTGGSRVTVCRCLRGASGSAHRISSITRLR